MEAIIERLHADGWRLYHSSPGVLFAVRGRDLDTAWELVVERFEQGARRWSLDLGWLAGLDPLEGRWPLNREHSSTN